MKTNQATKKAADKKFVSCLVLLTSLAFIMVAFGQGCAKHSGTQGSSDQSSVSADGRSLQAVEGDGVVRTLAIPTTPAISIQHFNQMLPNMELVTGAVASNATRTYFRSKLDELPDTGDPSTVSAPMWMAVTEISIRMCQDLVVKEAAAATTARRFFSAVNFAGTPANVTAAQRDAIIRSMARAFWGRIESAAERTELLNGLTTAFTNQTTPNSGLQVLCATMLAAIPAQEI